MPLKLEIGIELRNQILWVYEVLPFAQMVYYCVRASPRLCFLVLALQDRENKSCFTSLTSRRLSGTSDTEEKENR